VSQYKKDVIERTIRTAIQAAAAAVFAVWIQAGSFGQIEWSVVWQVAVFAAGASLLMALAAKPIGDPNSASVLPPG